MNNLFNDMMDIFVIVYLNEILIVSESEIQQQVHVRLEGMQWQQDNNLHAKPEKCEFHTHSMEYLGMIITLNHVTMDPNSKMVQSILSWPVPKNVKEQQSFRSLGFAYFYPYLIDKSSGIAKPLTKLREKNNLWIWTMECDSVFEFLERLFASVPILHHFDPGPPIMAKDYVIMVLQPPPDTVMLANMGSFKQWHAYLEEAAYTTQVYTDYNNHQFLTTTAKQLSRCQVHCSKFLSDLIF